jgi:hypothetical protein
MLLDCFLKSTFAEILGVRRKEKAAQNQLHRPFHHTTIDASLVDVAAETEYLLESC